MWILISAMMVSCTNNSTSFPMQEDAWWHLPPILYENYSDLPTSSKWAARGGTSTMTLTVDNKTMKFPRRWLSICFLLDFQQLTSLANAILSATSNATYSRTLYSNVMFLDHLRRHILEERLLVSTELIEPSWIPAPLERWILRQFYGLPNESGAYAAMKSQFETLYNSGINVWHLGEAFYTVIYQPSHSMKSS